MKAKLHQTKKISRLKEIKLWQDRASRQLKNCDVTICAAVDLILEQVDRGFPSALPRECDRDSAMDNCREIEELFRSDETRGNQDRLMDAVESIGDKGGPNDLDGVVLTLLHSFENFHVAIGFAAGLRSAGMSQSMARAMMLGLLRNFDVSEAAEAGMMFKSALRRAPAARREIQP